MYPEILLLSPDVIAIVIKLITKDHNFYFLNLMIMPVGILTASIIKSRFDFHLSNLFLNLITLGVLNLFFYLSYKVFKGFVPIIMQKKKRFIKLIALKIVVSNLLFSIVTRKKKSVYLVFLVQR